MKPITLHLDKAERLKRKRPVPVYEYRKHPHSLNARLHWAVRDAWNEAWHRAVFNAIANQAPGRFKEPLPKAAVTITYHAIRRIDRDNRYTAAKPIVDALKVWISKRKEIRGAGVIIDDDDEYLELNTKLEHVSKIADEHVSITISPI